MGTPHTNLARQYTPDSARRILDRVVVLFIVILVGTAPLSAVGQSSTVRFRLIDTATGQPTPAMVCITGRADGAVRLPPEGQVTTQPSRTEQFYNGIRFDPDRNWVGPVRKTAGQGDNKERSILYELRPSIPYWREPVMYQTSGDFTIDLPAGQWRIAVEHGLEYAPAVEEFVLKGDEQSPTRTIKLTRWINLPREGWWSGDVHVHHPILEDAHREYLLHYAVAEDLHVVNILEMGDHQTTHFRQMGFGKAYRSQRGDYCLAAGQEEPRSTFGHIIGLNINGLVRDVDNYDFYDLTFRRIHQQGEALVGFAHFELDGPGIARGFPWYVTTGELDFIEILQFSMLNAMDYYDYLNLGFRLTAAAGSDVPWGSTMGEVRTFVHTGPKLDIDAWFRGLKAGHTFVSNGPALEFTVDGELPGSELTRAGGSRVKIAAKVRSHPKVGRPTHLTVVGNDGVIEEIANDKKHDELTIAFERSIDRSQWLVASTVCDNGAVAHCTPVYVVVNGRPTWSAQRGPAVIDKQLAAIANIEEEFAKGTDARSQGVRERLHKARDYYARLRQKMQE